MSLATNCRTETVRRRSKRERPRAEVITDAGMEFPDGQDDTFAVIRAVRSEVAADRSRNERVLGELRHSIESLDLDEIRTFREWAQRQGALFDVYLDEFSRRLDEVTDLAPEPSTATDLASFNDRLDAAIGEAMTVRIELERLAERIQQRFDDLTIRLAEAEGRLAEGGGGVSFATQSDRIDEIERMVEHLCGIAETGGGAIAPTDPRIDVIATPGPDGFPPCAAPGGEVPSTGGSTDGVVAGDPLARLALSLSEADRAGDPETVPQAPVGNTKTAEGDR